MMKRVRVLGSLLVCVTVLAGGLSGCNKQASDEQQTQAQAQTKSQADAKCSKGALGCYAPEKRKLPW